MKSKTSRRIGILAALIALVAAGLCAVAPAANAGDAKTLSKWKNCETTQSAITVKTTFTDPAAAYGNGRYMVKKWIRWDYLKSGGQWRNGDTAHTETAWLEITNPQYDFVSTIGDKTKWLSLYTSLWRAHVIIKLLKNRPGPKDKVVETVEIWPMKGSFRNICDVEF